MCDMVAHQPARTMRKLADGRFVPKALHLFEQKGNIVMARRANALLKELDAGRS